MSDDEPTQLGTGPVGQESALTREITSDAEKRADRTVRQAEREAARIVADAEKEATAEREHALAQARERVEHAEGLFGARAAQHVDRLHLLARRALLDRVRERALRDLAALPGQDGYARSLRDLALDGIRAMTGDRFELVLRPDDRQGLGKSLAAEVAEAAGKELGRSVHVALADDDARCAGGLLVRSADGRQIADQTYGARIERLWSQIALRAAELMPAVRGDRGAAQGSANTKTTKDAGDT